MLREARNRNKNILYVTYILHYIYYICIYTHTHKHNLKTVNSEKQRVKWWLPGVGGTELGVVGQRVQTFH